MRFDIMTLFPELVDGILSAPLSSEVRDPEFFSKFRAANPDLDAKFISVYLVPTPELHLASLIHRDSYRDTEVIANYEEYRKTHPVNEPVWDADEKLYITFNSFEEREQKLAQLLDPLLKG